MLGLGFGLGYQDPTPLNHAPGGLGNVIIMANNTANDDGTSCPISISASGVEKVVGSAAVTLSGVSISASGVEKVVGTAAATLSISLSGSGTVV